MSIIKRFPDYLGMAKSYRERATEWESKQTRKGKERAAYWRKEAAKQERLHKEMEAYFARQPDMMQATILENEEDKFEKDEL